jgi:hypothetical protein
MKFLNKISYFIFCTALLLATFFATSFSFFEANAQQTTNPPQTAEVGPAPATNTTPAVEVPKVSEVKPASVILPEDAGFDFGPPPSAANAKPSEAKAPEAEVAADLNKREQVTAKVAKLADFYRIEFESTNYVAFSPSIDGNTLTIDFDKPNNLSAAIFGKNLDIVRAYGESGDGKSLTLKLSVGDLKIRRFISDNFTTGFDLFFDKQKEVKRKVIYKTQLIDGEISTEVSAEEDKKNKAAGLKTVKKFVPSNTIVIFPKAFIGPPAISQLFKMPEDFIGPPPVDFTKVTIYEVEKQLAENTVSVTASTSPNGVTLKIPFVNTVDVGAASIWKNGKLIIVFDTAVNLDLENAANKNYIKEIEQYPSKENAILVIKNFSETEKKYRGPIDVSLYKNNDGWNVDIYEEYDGSPLNTNKTEPLNVASENFWGENRVTVSKANFSKGVNFFDLDTGEKLVFFPAKDNGVAIFTKREFVDFKIYKTIQGAVIEEKSDFLNYDTADNKVEVTKLPNLVLSEEILSQDLTNVASNDDKDNNKVKGIFSDQSIFPFEKALIALAEKEALKNSTKEKKSSKKDGDETDEALDEKELEKQAELKEKEKKKNYYKLRIEFQEKIIKSKIEDRTRIKFNYASALFEHGLYVEAKGILDDITKTSPNFEDIQKAKIIHAGSEFLIGAYNDAYDSFSKILPELINNVHYNEIKLWQWASNLMALKKDNKYDDGKIKVDFIASFDKFMQQYPDDLKMIFGLMFIENKIAENQLNDAKNLIDIITYRGIPDNVKNDVDFLTAKLEFLQGSTEKAQHIYEELSENISDRKNRGKARFELVKQKLILDQVTISDAIKELEALSFMWRDDYFEVDVAELVGQLYLSQNKYMPALLAWKSVATNFPNTADSIVVLGKMKRVFIDLFDGGIAYKMKPMEALNLYFSFQELMPVGEIGDKISRKFADYLVKTDLPDDAIKIIEHQVKFRTQGEARFRTALQLADLYIKNKEFRKASDTLKIIDNKAASREILKQLKYRQAMIEALNGSYTKALDLLRDDFSKDAMTIRLELFWQRENWFGVKNIVETRLAEINDTRPSPLTKTELDLIIKLAVAYSAQEEFEKLQGLKKSFRDRIQSQSDLRLFDYLAMEKTDLDPANFDVSLQLAEIERFMNEYNYMPLQNWKNVITVLEPKVFPLKGKSGDDISRAERLEIIRLTLAYILIEKKDDKEDNYYKKRIGSIARDFKDIRIDRQTIDAMAILDNKVNPIEPDAIFEGSIKVMNFADFIPMYKKASKISELNEAIKGQFK